MKMESIRKLSIFVSSGQKTCTRIISIILHSFLLFSRAINVVSYRYMKSFQRQFLREPKKTNFKSFKFHNMKSYARRFYLCLLNSCEIWNFISLGSHKNLSFGVISYNLVHCFIAPWKPTLINTTFIGTSKLLLWTVSLFLAKALRLILSLTYRSINTS